MTHTLFLLDLDDTLLDFKASERLAFERVARGLGVDGPIDALFGDYQAINLELWRRFERGEVDKETLKVQRFRQSFDRHALDLDAARASELYLDHLAECVVLIDGATELVAGLAEIGEVGVITNGVQRIQHRRIEAAGLSPHIAFVATSEACGHAKPDVRFFDFSVRMARRFDAASTLIVGDRLDADILGANRFGIDSCWFNPHRLINDSEARPTFEVDALAQVLSTLRGEAGAGR